MLNVERNSKENVESVVKTGSCLLTPAPCSILLIAVNARYSHSSYSVRTLKANLHELEDKCGILETEISITPYQLAAEITKANPSIAGFSVYLWNVRIIEATVRILKEVAPETKLVAGGPELTPDYKNADLFDLCIIGEGESALREYCRSELTSDIPTAQPVFALRSYAVAQQELRPPLQNVINTSQREGESPDEPRKENHIIECKPEDTKKLKLPYHLYSDGDIANRVIYVEASRGCPYRCTYCTSAGTGLRLIPLETLLPGLDNLWQRGVRRFKFLDRSFTAAKEHALAIMDFFMDRSDPEMCLHFEVYTDILHPEIKEMMQRFPVGALHLECGVQTLNPEVAERIGRSVDVNKTLSNLRFLTDESGADVHADLIFGLPGEDEKSFAKGFNKLINNCNPPAVQVNLLKALPGTELSKKTDLYKLHFNPEPPYELLKSDVMNFRTLNRIQRLARCWELVHNRENFADEVSKLMAISEDVYSTFMQLAEHIYKAEGRMHRIAKARLKKLIGEFLKG